MEVSRRQLLQGVGAVGLGLLAGCGQVSFRASPPPKVHRLGWLVAAGSAPSEGLRQALAELGYVEGQNVVFEFRSAEGRDEQLPALAAELVRLPVDLLLVVGAPATRAAQQATQDIPIVMAPAGDPLGTSLVSTAMSPASRMRATSSRRNGWSCYGKPSPHLRVWECSGGWAILVPKTAGAKHRRLLARWGWGWSPWNCTALRASTPPSRQPHASTSKPC
jgi:hypothetical protein